MMRFSYIARMESGKLTRGEFLAISASAAQENLQKRGVQPVSITEIQDHKFSRIQLNVFSWLDLAGVRSSEIENALQQLALMNRSGLGLVASLHSVREQSKSHSFQRIVDSIISDLQNGSSLHFAMNKHKAFSKVLLQLIAVGEATGELASVLEQGAAHMAKLRKRVAALYSLLAYPFIVMITGLSVAGYLIVFVIPKLQVFLMSLGKPLPRMTQSLITVSQWIQTYGVTIVAAFLAVLMVVCLIYRNPRGRLMLDRALFRIPLLGTILRLSATITFSSTLGTMLRNGVSLVDALSAIERLHVNRYLSVTVGSIRQSVVRGQSLTAPLSRTTAYMPMLARMISVAEKTGETDKVLAQVTQFHEEQLMTLTKRLGTMIEPALIVFVGGFVGYVYIAFFIALMGAGGR